VTFNLKRFTLCLLLGHKWARIPYPPPADEEATDTGTFLRCLRCGHENYEAGTVPRGAGGMMH
jgi:hypothetical protein